MQMVHFIPPSQRRLAILASQADSAPVLVYGASGTGKGAIARWIHAHSARSTKPFLIAQHEAPLAKQILAAQEGTLVIHEVGEYPLAEQKTLLQFLTTKSVPVSSPAGSPDEAPLKAIANVRIIATTSAALEGRAQGGLFNADLLQKLNVFRLEMPALEKRRHESQDEFEDIVMGLVAEIARELHKEHLRELSDEAWDALHAYDWPGNLRELRNVLRVAVVAAQGDQIDAGDLPEFGPERLDFRATREQFEKIYITELLKTFHWQIDQTCVNARMDKSTLLTKIKKYGIHVGPLESPHSSGA